VLARLVLRVITPLPPNVARTVSFAGRRRLGSLNVTRELYVHRLVSFTRRLDTVFLPALICTETLPAQPRDARTERGRCTVPVVVNR